MTWVLTLLGIMALIVLHELGHFVVAKAVGMRVERFSLFFPPRLFGRKIGETDYSVGAIPLGGYVKITGMTPEELAGDVDPEVTRRAYYNQSPWKRVAVIVAGPAVNIVIAFVLFASVLLAGNLNGAIVLSNLSSVETTVATDRVGEVERGTPAQAALRAGDRILTVDGLKATPARVMQVTSSHRCAGPQVQGCTSATAELLTVLRGGRQAAVTVYPRYNATAKRALVGFVFGRDPKHFGLGGASAGALSAMWGTVRETLSGLGHAFTEEKARKQIHSIIGITQTAQETVAAGAGYALVFLGFFSLVLAVLNLFPFLPLDGGHVVWSLAEKIRGRRISLAAMYRYSSVGILLLLFLVVNGFSNDISRLGG